jgi:hypothetical protein
MRVEAIPVLLIMAQVAPAALFTSSHVVWRPSIQMAPLVDVNGQGGGTIKAGDVDAAGHA